VSPLSGILGGALSSSALNLLVLGGNSLGMIRAMQTQGAIRDLAETEHDRDGRAAGKLLAGGEFPCRSCKATVLDIDHHSSSKNMACV